MNDKRALLRDEKAIHLFMLLIAAALSIKYIFVDFGIDAEFQISMSYRLAKGDTMFLDMWEPYQTSAFLCTFFIKIYLFLFRTTDGIVLFLQTIGVLLDGLVAYIMYKVISKYLHCGNTAFAMAWVFFLISPKDVPLPEYANMQIWFSMLLCITLFVYYKTQHKRYIILAALCMCCVVLSYPSCLILFLGVLLILFHKQDKKGCIYFGTTCGLAGILYMCFVFSQVSFEEFSVFIENMLALETSHSVGLFEKTITYIKEASGIAIFFSITYIISYIIIRTLKKNANNVYEKEMRMILTDALFFFFVLLAAFYTVICWEKYSRFCYSIVFLSTILIGTHYRKKLSPDKYFLYICGTVLSLLQFFATLALTNLVLIASIPYLLMAAVMAFLPITEALQVFNITEIQRNFKTALLLCGIIFMAFRNAYIIRPLYGHVESIFQIGGIVKQGPALGIISEYMGPYMQNETIKEWDQYIKPGESIYLIGGSLDTLGYLYSDTIISAPSLVPTPGYNESILKYWELHPEKYPDVIIAYCWYGNLHSQLTEDSWIMKWIETKYSPTHYIDGKYWRYYFKNKTENTK